MIIPHKYKTDEQICQIKDCQEKAVCFNVSIDNGWGRITSLCEKYKDELDDIIEAFLENKESDEKIIYNFIMSRFKKIDITDPSETFWVKNYAFQMFKESAVDNVLKRMGKK